MAKMPSVLNDPKLDSMLPSLHLASKGQDEAIERYYFKERTGPWLGMEPRDHAFMADKLVALDREKAEFCYMICRAIGTETRPPVSPWPSVRRLAALS